MKFYNYFFAFAMVWLVTSFLSNQVTDENGMIAFACLVIGYLVMMFLDNPVGIVKFLFGISIGYLFGKLFSHEFANGDAVFLSCILGTGLAINFVNDVVRK